MSPPAITGPLVIPVTPEHEDDLARFQNASEAKFPPETPRRRLHELPSQSAPNQAAAPPTIVEELPVPRDPDDATEAEST